MKNYASERSSCSACQEGSAHEPKEGRDIGEGGQFKSELRAHIIQVIIWDPLSGLCHGLFLLFSPKTIYGVISWLQELWPQHFIVEAFIEVTLSSWVQFGVFLFVFLVKCWNFIALKSLTLGLVHGRIVCVNNPILSCTDRVGRFTFPMLILSFLSEFEFLGSWALPITVANLARSKMQ